MVTGRSGTTRYSVPQMARLLGISERAVRKQIESGKLSADREGRRWIVTLAEPVSDQDPELSGTSAVPDKETNGTAAKPIEAAYRPMIEEASRRYLEELRDQWLMPLIHENGELQKTIGRLEAERDQLRVERDELRARLKPIALRHGDETPGDKRIAETKERQIPWWQFWNR